MEMERKDRLNSKQAHKEEKKSDQVESHFILPSGAYIHIYGTCHPSSSLKFTNAPALGMHRGFRITGSAFSKSSKTPA
jgi:hypothetical protein